MKPSDQAIGCGMVIYSLAAIICIASYVCERIATNVKEREEKDKKEWLESAHTYPSPKHHPKESEIVIEKDGYSVGYSTTHKRPEWAAMTIDQRNVTSLDLGVRTDCGIEGVRNWSTSEELKKDPVWGVCSQAVIFPGTLNYLSKDEGDSCLCIPIPHSAEGAWRGLHREIYEMVNRDRFRTKYDLVFGSIGKGEIPSALFVAVRARGAFAGFENAAWLPTSTNKVEICTVEVVEKRTGMKMFP